MSSPVLVIGGGIAGSAAAILLARAGERVVLFEQHREPRHKVCGEFLSAEACDSLRRLGLDLGRLGALPLRTLRLTRGAHTVQAPLPFPALSLTRRCLDAEMLSLAAGAGVELRPGTRIDGLHLPDEHGGPAPARHTQSELPGVQVVMANGSTVAGRTVFLANGKHDLRGHSRRHARSAQLIAFKQYFRLRPGAHAALREAIELHLFRGGYAGLQMVETGEANLSLLVDARRLRALGGWPQVFAHVCRDAAHLRHHLAEAEPVLPRPLALSHIPYGFLASGRSRVWGVGDQAAVIPSFTGDGIAIALHSAQLAVEAFLAGETPAHYVQQLRADLSPNMRRARALARLLLTPGLREVSVAAAACAPQLLSRLACATRIQPAAVHRLAVAGQRSSSHAVRIQ